MDNKKQSQKKLEVIKIKTDSVIFGHLDFFQDKVHSSSAKSTKVSDVLVVSRIDFLAVIKNYPNDFVYQFIIFSNGIVKWETWSNFQTN